MDGSEVRARVSALVERRPAVPDQGWKDDAEEFRLDFFGSNHKSLSLLAKLHAVVSCEHVREVFWLDDGKSFAINRDGYKDNIMSVFFDHNRIKSLLNRLSDNNFELGRSMGRFPDHVAHKFLVYSHPSFIPEGLLDSMPGSPSNRNVGATEAALNDESNRSRTEDPSESKDGATKAALNESSASYGSEDHGMDSEDDDKKGRDKEAEDDKMMIDMMPYIVHLDRTSSETQQDQLLRELDICQSPRRDSETASCCSMATLSVDFGSGNSF
ncbi:hypothetical protein ACHAXT_006807 [Thalassiosira profunda]